MRMSKSVLIEVGQLLHTCGLCMPYQHLLWFVHVSVEGNSTIVRSHICYPRQAR